MHKNTLNLAKVIGHRGACGYAPENTLASMRKARELGATWVEFDVMLTADNHPILMHDETLEHTTNGQGAVADVLFAAIRQLDAGSWFNPKFANERIPALQEVLDCTAEIGLSINLEIKPTSGRDVITAQKTVETLRQHWQKEQVVLISSFSLASLKTVRSMDASLPMGLLIHEWTHDWRQQLDKLDCISLNVNHEILTPAIVTEVKGSGRYVLTYTVNDIERAKELYSWGVDAVFTDFPDKINL